MNHLKFVEFASAPSDVDGEWDKKMVVWRVNIARKDGVEASAEEIEFSRICVNTNVGRWTTDQTGKRPRQIIA